MSATDLINARLPDDLLAHLFHHVAARGAAKTDLDSCALVCRRWCSVERASRRAARVPVDGFDGDVVVRCVAERFTGLTDVALDQGLHIAPGASAVAAQRQRAQAWDNESSKPLEHNQCFTPSTALEEDLSNGSGPTSLTDAGLIHLVEGCKKLEKLTLNWFLNISVRGLVGIANGCQNLKSLALSGGCVPNHGLIALAEGCNINDLKLCAVQKLTDEGLVEFVKIRSKSLFSLDVSVCDGCITDRSLDAIGTYCHNLEVLSVESNSKHVKENEGIISVAKGCQSLKSLKLVGLGVGDEALEAVGSFCSALETLSLDSLVKCSDRSLSSIANGCKQMKNLALKSSVKFTDRSIELVSQNCKMLQHLKISMCQTVQTAALEHIGQRCTNLLELTLSGLWIENNAFPGFGRCCFLLKSVYLAMCCKISDEAIYHITQGCKNLRELSIISCCQIGDEAIISIGENCKELRELTLHCLKRLTDRGLAAVDQCCKLQKLDIYGCKQITDYGLTAIIRECHDLVYLDISDIKNIGDSTLAKVGEAFPKLKHLVMLRCDAISDIGLAHIARGCLQLEVCEVFWCSQVTPAGVATLVEGSCMLQSLIVEESKVSDETTAKCRIDAPILHL